MVDRYKYFDLLPCNQNELKAIGYKDIPVKIPKKYTLFKENIISKIKVKFNILKKTNDFL